MRCFPLGLVDKKSDIGEIPQIPRADNKCLIFHLSHLANDSVNSHIAVEDKTVQYQSLDIVIHKIAELSLPGCEYMQ